MLKKNFNIITAIISQRSSERITAASPERESVKLCRCKSDWAAQLMTALARVRGREPTPQMRDAVMRLNGLFHLRLSAVATHWHHRLDNDARRRFCG